MAQEWLGWPKHRVFDGCVQEPGFHGVPLDALPAAVDGLPQFTLRSSDTTRNPTWSTYRLWSFRRSVVSIFRLLTWLNLPYFEVFFWQYFLVSQVCDRSEEWKEGRFEEDAERFSESDVFEKGLQGTEDAMFFQT